MTWSPLTLRFLALFAGLAPILTWPLAVSPARGSATLPQFVRTVQVAPEGRFTSGQSCRAVYRAASQRVVVTFAANGAADDGSPGYAYREYDPDLTHPGRSGCVLPASEAAPPADSASLLVGDALYFLTSASGHAELLQLDPDWRLVGRREVELGLTGSSVHDPMLTLLDGQLLAAIPVTLAVSPGAPVEVSFHRYFSARLEPRQQRLLAETAHGSGTSLVEAGGRYFLFTATPAPGNLAVVAYDHAWTCLGARYLARGAASPQGAVYADGRFYVTYLDLARPGTANVTLGILDNTWRWVSTTPVTDFQPEQCRRAGQPSLLKVGTRFYVTYDVETLDARTGQPGHASRAYVSLYEVQVPRTTASPPNTSSFGGCAGVCPTGAYSRGIPR